MSVCVICRCGIGTIPIEGALAFPYCFFVGGELSAESMQQARANEQWTREQSKLRLRQGQRQGQRGQSSDPCSDSSDKNSSSSVVQPFSLNVEFVQWNAGSIPVRSGSVDIVVCDMPFGMKHGNYRLNRKLYPLFFREMLRILSENGKVSCIYYVVQSFSRYSYHFMHTPTISATVCHAICFVVALI